MPAPVLPTPTSDLNDAEFQELDELLAATPEDDLAAFVQRAIGPLVRHDRANHTDLVETLSVWLETRNMAEAARRTHVHYNTLKNRMERIEAIVGPVLTDASAWLGARLVGEPRPSGWSLLVEAAVEHVEVGTSEQPLLHRRGRYLSLSQAGVDSA